MVRVRGATLFFSFYFYYFFREDYVALGVGEKVLSSAAEKKRVPVKLFHFGQNSTFSKVSISNRNHSF